MTLDAFTAAELATLYREARARADAMHHKAARITLDEMIPADSTGDDRAWNAADAAWHVAMAAGDEAKELMGAITDELEHRADERYRINDEH